ncbi:monosaccharide transporter, partial [Trichoderma arundinaceum]
MLLIATRTGSAPWARTDSDARPSHLSRPSPWSSSDPGLEGALDDAGASSRVVASTSPARVSEARRHDNKKVRLPPAPSLVLLLSCLVDLCLTQRARSVHSARVISSSSIPPPPDSHATTKANKAGRIPIRKKRDTFNDMSDAPEAKGPDARKNSVGIHTAQDVEHIEAPITWKAYLICAFASFGGIFFGYDSGYINGVNGSSIFYKAVEGAAASKLSDSNTSLITSILSCGTFFGALIAGDISDWIGRKWTVIIGCIIYALGVVIQMVTAPGHALGPIVAGRLIAGLGVGFESAIVILYMSEICPRKVRGALVAGYQFCITIGILLASCVVYGTKDRSDTGAYRIPIALQFPWAMILGGGLLFLPDSPRYFVKKGEIQKAINSLARVRGQPEDSEYVQNELAEIIANEEYERALIPSTTWFGSWANCFKGSLWTGKSNLRRTILGTSLQMMQQWTGVNFIFYYSTPFLQSTGAIGNSFLISLIFSLVNVCSTPLSFWTVERFGRRTILIVGAGGMLICQFLVAIIGVTIGFNKTHPNP